MISNKRSGYTLIELILLIALFGFASILFFSQKNNLNIVNQDNAKKTAINAMYYSLEEVYYKNNGYYPREINSKILPSMDPELFKDINNLEVNAKGSSYTYSPLNCENNKCKAYELRAVLSKESDYIKTNRNN